MKFSILDSRDSLLLEKTFLDYRRGQKTETFYEKNHSLSLWLKWTEKSWKKLKYFLEQQFLC